MPLLTEISYLASIVLAKRMRLLERITVLEESFNSSVTEVPNIVTAINASIQPLEYSIPTHYTPVFTNPTLV
jgi:CheY-specific phosphatase CheX